MKDRYGREINYMRISVTDRCNLRCRYCMPEGGVESIGHDEILRFDEILKIVRLAAGLGIKNIKITGGEPLVRRDVVSLIGDIKSLNGIDKVTLTTNGSLLEDNLKELVSVGLDGVNISLDTLDDLKYQELTGGGDVEKVKKAIIKCAGYPGLKTKVNVVTICGFNEDEVTSFGRIAAEHEADVRFIEMMPIGMGKNFGTVYQKDVMERLEKRFGKAEPACGNRGNGPAAYYDFEGFKGKIGFISPLSHQFCDKCNRIRLTAGGLLKPCLQYGGGADLKAALRLGKSDEALEEIIRKAIFEKPLRHRFSSGGLSGGEEREEPNRESRFMSEIGG